MCEPPNTELHTFTGKLTVGDKSLPLDNDNVLLRVCGLLVSDTSVGPRPAMLHREGDIVAIAALLFLFPTCSTDIVDQPRLAMMFTKSSREGLLSLSPLCFSFSLYMSDGYSRSAPPCHDVHGKLALGGLLSLSPLCSSFSPHICVVFRNEIRRLLESTPRSRYTTLRA